MSVNLTPFLTATKKNTEKCSYFHLLDFKLLYSLRPSIHKFHETEEHFYYALETYYIYFILFYLAHFQNILILEVLFPYICQPFKRCDNYLISENSSWPKQLKKYFVRRFSRFEYLPLFLFPSVTSEVRKKREEEIKKKNRVEMRKEKYLGSGNSNFFVNYWVFKISFMAISTNMKVWLNSLHYAKLELVQLSPGVFVLSVEQRKEDMNNETGCLWRAIPTHWDLLWCFLSLFS